MDKLPLPTDNIYKFYALFGLVLFIFSIGGIIVLQRGTNEYLTKSAPRLAALQAIENASPAELAERDVLKRRIDIAISDKGYFNNWLSFFCVVGLYGGLYGFWKWHRKIQPVEDEMRTLQRDKLKLEVEKMKAETAATALAENQPPAPAGSSSQSGPSGTPPSH